MYLQIFCCLLMASYAYSFTTMTRPIAHNALVIHNYTGVIPTEKMQNVDQVLFDACNINFIDGQTYSFPKLKKLKLRNSILGDVPEIAMAALLSLDEFVAENTTFENFRLEDLNNLPDLDTLHISNVKSETLPQNFLNKLNKLKSLKISSADVSSIDKNAFSGLGNLETLDLSDNKLKTISKEVLTPCKKLKTLILRRNQIEKFGPENIPELPNLVTVDLGYNPVNDVDTEGLKKIAPKLDDISVGATD